jgi:DNA-binding MarR family transcriptional regulator
MGGVMAGPVDSKGDHILLGILESVERDGAWTQRTLSAELGVALGLVNIYLKRCVKKGLVKMREAPARRYVYYLTPQGLSEKSRLTVEYLSSSLSFFRRARTDCAEILTAAQAEGWQRIALAGASDLAEIATICALERGMDIVAVVDHRTTAPHFVGRPVVASFDTLAEAVDGVLVTDMSRPRETFEAASAFFGARKVMAPRLLGAGPKGSVR